MKTTIYVERHGQSLGNLSRNLLGHTDLGLTELGRSQAELTARHLKDVCFSAIYSSDLIRAYCTAVPHTLYHNLKITTSRKLREIFLGEWENGYVPELKSNYPELFEEVWVKRYGLFKAPGGESVLDGGIRLRDELIRLGRLHSGETILVVCHAGIIRSMWGIINGIDPSLLVEHFAFPLNASFSIVEFDGEQLRPISYSVSP